MYYKFVHVWDVDGWIYMYKMMFRINWMLIINDIFFQITTISELYYNCGTLILYIIIRGLNHSQHYIRYMTEKSMMHSYKKNYPFVSNNQSNQIYSEVLIRSQFFII